MEQTVSSEVVKEITLISLNREFITELINDPPFLFILSQMNPNHSYYGISVISILKFSFHLCLGLPSGRSPSCFPLMSGVNRSPGQCLMMSDNHTASQCRVFPSYS
jgi:hypothetical protein